MARFRSSHKKLSIPAKYILLVLSIICVIMMVLSYTTDILNGPLETVAGYTVIPFQKAISYAGDKIADNSDKAHTMEELTLENEQLRQQVDELTIQINSLTRDKYELADLRQLMALDNKYSDYPTIGARVIGKDAGNWYSTFLIDKGTNDGLAIDMNVMAGSGLVGIITDVGPNWAKVRSIIDDSSNLSGMVLNTSDNMIVSGDLELYSEGNIKFSDLIDSDDEVVQGDQVVTSQISDKYLPGISVGFISEINPDSNNLTKSGYIQPIVVFEHLSTVLIITKLKEYVESE